MEWNVLGVCALVIFCFMSLQFLIAIKLENNSIVDIGWGLGFVIVTITSFLMNSTPTFSSKVLSLLVVIWGLRLSVYLFIRNRNKPEDWRYAKWRKEWGKNVVWRSFWQVFMLQGFILWVNCLPIMFTNAAKTESDWGWLFLMIGSLCWLIGFSFEAIADYQLFIFKSDKANKGKIIVQGLWRYSRHPNYFGEAVLQWGIWFLSVSAGYWLVTIIAPISITYLLLKVSGVVMLESKYKGNKEYEQYIARTSAFVPLPPKSY